MEENNNSTGEERATFRSLSKIIRRSSSIRGKKEESPSKKRRGR